VDTGKRAYQESVLSVVYNSLHYDPDDPGKNYLGSTPPKENSLESTVTIMIVAVLAAVDLITGEIKRKRG
jgi:hypothetical protein